MSPDTPCPDDQDIRRLVLGLLDRPTAAGLDAHFADCPRCAARADRLATPDDGLLAAVQSAAATRLGEVPDIPDSILRRLGRLCRAAGVVRPGERIGSYQVDRPLGRGGMGEVYLARHERLSRPVALKILPSGAGADRLARFYREAEAVAALRHPNIVQVHEVGDDGGRQFLVMEFADGGTLAGRLADAPLPPAEAARLAEALARAVEHAHARGIIHRDLKPSNVLLGADGTPKVSDFGLAKLLEGDGWAGVVRTDTGAILGTPGYMAPEQATGGPIGPAADVYGLGAILYECLTGCPPFRAATALEALDQVRIRDPAPPRQLQPGVPRDLETVCLRCLEKDPNRRYPSADDLADDLSRFLRGEPVRARPVGPARRAWKWARRRPTAAALVATCAAATVALAAVVAAYTVRLREAVTRANESAAAADREHRQAAANYRSARDALKRILRRLADRHADQIPRLKELQRDQLEDALAFYEGVLGGLDDPDQEVQLDAALTLVEVGTIRGQLGLRGEGAADLRRAAGALERLPDEYRSRPDCRNGLATCYNHFGNQAIAAGRWGEAEALFRKVLADQSEPTGPGSADPDRELARARAEHNLGMVLHLSRQLDLAATAYLRSIETRGRLVDRFPQADHYRAGLAESWLNLGHVYDAQRRPGEAAAAFRRADDLLRQLVEAHPGDDEFGLSLAGVGVNWGNLLRATDLPVALAKFDRAVELVDAAVAREPRYAAARGRAVEAHGARALAREQAGRLAEAVADWDRVIELAAEPARVGYRVSRADLMLRAGMHARARSEALDLSRADGLPADHRYHLACALSRAGSPAKTGLALGVLAEVAASEMCIVAALRLLRQLHAEKYFDRPDKSRYLVLDPRLQTLRGRRSFWSLFALPTTRAKR